MNMKIRKGDRVMVVRGNTADKGKIGEVIRVEPNTMRVVVQGVNLVKKHQKQTQSKGRQIPSGIIEFEAPIHVSNVALVLKNGQTTRIGSKIDENGNKVRYAKKTGEVI